MAQAVLSVRMDEDTKRAFARFCEQAGMSVSTAVNLFARQTVRDGRMPFVISVGDTCADALSREEIGRAVATAAEPYPAIRRVVLFGSQARGDAGPGGDIDLRLMLDARERFSAMNLAAFCGEVEDATGRQVDAVTTEHIEHERLAQAIEREGVVIYEREG